MPELKKLDTEQIEHEASMAVATAQEIVVKDDESYTKTAGWVKDLKGIRKLIDETFDPHVKTAHGLWKGLIAEKKKHSAPLDEAEGIVKRKLSDYTQAQEKVRRAEEQRLREEARKKAEAEQLAAAQAAEEAGDAEEAERLLDEEVIPEPVIVEPAAPKVEGVSYRTTWKFRITDEKKIPREYLAVDEKKIGQVVRALKDQAKIPGVEAYAAKSMAVGSG